MHLSKIILIFTSNGQGVVAEFNSSSNTENSLNSIISCHKVKFFFSQKKSALSKSLIIMKSSKYLICVLLSTEYWTAKACLKTSGGKNYLATLLLDSDNSVNLPFYINHYYTNISKQILEYIFPLCNYLESWMLNQMLNAKSC